ncbi:enoyl-CoA hydratase/isomerase family protein [Streptomyces cyaneochromogenes]|uniref:Enoyl-CoA hydratase/isomerase family protein n=1 Tax=Streptomyces cyaneochromogenes TaxID=2496836 RepID=A0A3S9MF78_9ACTN|nr:enoyl-CoA hydratase/isomerase family protein [Streptomyces cyaneochromogenes]AZQ37871.1 enoyl-CoA hydratase/isomerase family protein [Streptomyces cyaneochromogenes]
MNPPTATTSIPPRTPIGVTQDGPVLHVRLNPSVQDDTLSTAVLDDLIAALDNLHERPDIRILVLSSMGDDFCLGADRREYRDALALDPTGAALRRVTDKAHRLCQALENTHAVTIARLHGKVIGAGLALAAYCDLRAGADSCRFRMPEVGIGLAPAWGGAMGRLIAEAGAARIRELMLTCDAFDAVTAHRLGLLHKVAPLDQLDDTVAAWTRPLARRSPEALLLTKRMLTGYAKAARTADVTLLDSHLLTAQLVPYGGDG